MIIENKEVLNNPEAIEAISQLQNIVRIRILDVIKRGYTVNSSSGVEIDHGGKSGAVIIYVEAEPDENAKWNAGYYYIKVNPGEREEINQERIKRLKLLQNTAPQAVVEVVELTVHKRSLVEMTGSAQQRAGAEYKVRRLTDLLKSHTHLTQRYIRGVAQILFDWSKDSEVIYYDLEEIFLIMFEDGRLRKHPTRKIDQRARILFKQLRWKHQAESSELPVDIERLSTASKLSFGDYPATPNPIAYVNNPEWWQSLHQIPFRTAFSHQDLHSDNIICDLSPDSDAEALAPDIIDLTDYKPIHTVFWDFLYFEFDLLIRAGQPDKRENRHELWRLVSTLLEHDLDEPINYDGPFLFQSIFNCIQILREKVIEHIQYFDDMGATPRRKERYQLAFWVVATGVGLNYMRKSSISLFSRLLGLFYAANAFQHVVQFGRFEEVISNDDTLTIPDWQRLVQKAIPTKVDGYISDVLSPALTADNPIVICLSPDFNPVDEDTLRDAIQSRLVWWMDKDEADTPRNILEAMSDFVDKTSDLNLGTLIRRLSYAQKPSERQPLLQQLSALCERLPNLTLVTTAWYEPLFPDPNSDNNFEPHSVIYLCGHTDVPKSLCTLHDLTEDPTNPFLLRQYERLRTLLFNDRTRFIFLGSQPMDELGWQFLFDESVQNADYIDTSTTPLRLSGNIEQYHFTPEEFIAEFYEAYRKQAPRESLECQNKSLEAYTPPSIVHSNLQEEIVHHEARLWVVNDVAWTGKSTFLHSLCKQHAKWYRVSDVRKCLLVDFDAHQTLRAQKRAVLALLLDHYHADYPETDAELELTDTEKLFRLLAALDKSENFSKYDKELLVCFDGLAQDDPYVLDWLREELAPKLAVQGITVVFALRTFHDKKPTNLTKWEQPYEFRSLEWIPPREVKARILDYVKKVNWDEDRYAELDSNLENWTYRQALTYTQLGRSRMMIVDKLFREHMAEDELNLGYWPQDGKWGEVEQNIVFETIWNNIETELGLKKLSAEPPRWFGSNDASKTLVMTPGVDKIYRELLMCRRISGEFIYQWSATSDIPLPKFLPTMLSELQSLAYIQYDDRPLRMGASRELIKNPVYFVSDIIYTTMQRHFYYAECRNASTQEIEQSTLYRIMWRAYLYFTKLANEAEKNKLGELMVSYAVDVIYTASVLYALEHPDAPKPKVELKNYSHRLEKLNITPALLRAEFSDIQLAWQIDAVREVLQRVMELI